MIKILDITIVQDSVLQKVAQGNGFSRMDSVVENLINSSILVAGKVLAALVILIVGRYVIKLLNKLFAKLLDRQTIDAGVKSFLRSLINGLLVILLLVAVAGKLGLETTSFAALLASFGVAIGMAMSGNLSNLVSGMLILMFKPYRVGDWVEIDGVAGEVLAIEIFHTILRTPGGCEIYFSNGKISGAVIRNYSKEEKIRIDAVFSISYEEDLKRVEQVLLSLVAEDARILQEPAPSVGVSKLADSGVEVALRIWVKTDDYLSVKGEITGAAFKRFTQENISLSYPQIVVHQANA